MVTITRPNLKHMEAQEQEALIAKFKELLATTGYGQAERVYHYSDA
jgi:hypothetical protein